MRIAYYPGCTLKATAKSLESSALASAKALGIEMVEPEKWNCCGVVPSLTSDDLMRHIGPLRNLIHAQEMSKAGSVDGDPRILTLCAMCYNTLKSTNLRMRTKPDDLKTLNEFNYLDENYDGKVEVLHYLELLRDIGWDKVAVKVRKPLTGLKIAPYYGCLLLRPKEIGIDDPEEPTIQNELLNALGAESITFPYATRCCGSYQTVPEKYSVAEMTYEIIAMARKYGAEALSTSCPLCAFNLDNRQKEVQEKHSHFKPMPVFYFTQLMALAFGADQKECGFELNYIEPMTLLKEKKLM